MEGFDAEQIWLQLEMQSEGALKRARRLFKKAGEVPRLVLPEMEEALDGEWLRTPSVSFKFGDQMLEPFEQQGMALWVTGRAQMLHRVFSLSPEPCFEHGLPECAAHSLPFVQRHLGVLLLGAA